MKQKSLVVEHLYTTDFSDSKLNDISSYTSRSPNRMDIIKKDKNKGVEYDTKSCSSNFSTNTSKKKGFVGFLQNIFK